MINYTNTEKKFSVLCTLMLVFFPLEIENKCVVKFCGHHLQFLPVFLKLSSMVSIFGIYSWL